MLPYASCISVFESSDNFCLALLGFACLVQGIDVAGAIKSKATECAMETFGATFPCDFSVCGASAAILHCLKRHELLLTMFQIHLIHVYSGIFLYKYIFL